MKAEQAGELSDTIISDIGLCVKKTINGWILIGRDGPRPVKLSALYDNYRPFFAGTETRLIFDYLIGSNLCFILVGDQYKTIYRLHKTGLDYWQNETQKWVSSSLYVTQCIGCPVEVVDNPEDDKMLVKDVSCWQGFVCKTNYNEISAKLVLSPCKAILSYTTGEQIVGTTYEEIKNYQVIELHKNGEWTKI